MKMIRGCCLLVPVLALACVDDPNVLGQQQGSGGDASGGTGTEGGTSAAPATGGDAATGGTHEGTGGATGGSGTTGGSGGSTSTPGGAAGTPGITGGAAGAPSATGGAAGAPISTGGAADTGGAGGAATGGTAGAPGATGGGGGSDGTVTLDLESLTFFELPINSVRYAVSGYDPAARTCVTIQFDYSNTGRMSLVGTEICDEFGPRFPYVTVAEEQDAPCGTSIWEYSGAEPAAVSGCFDNAQPLADLELTVDWQGTTYQITTATTACDQYQAATLEGRYALVFNGGSLPASIDAYVGTLSDPSLYTLSEGCGMRAVGPINTGLYGRVFTFDDSGAVIGWGAWDDVFWGPCSQRQYSAGTVGTFSPMTLVTVPCGTPVRCGLDEAVAGVHCP